MATKKPQPYIDTLLIDELEAYLKKWGGLVLHEDGFENVEQFPGLGMRCTGRNLRQAPRQMAGLENA